MKKYTKNKFKKICKIKDDPTKCYMNQTTKDSEGSYYIVSKTLKGKNKGKKYWKNISKTEKNCRQQFARNVSKNMEKYKKKDKIYNPKQAIAISYSQLFRKKPKCEEYLGKKSKKVVKN